MKNKDKKKHIVQLYGKSILGTVLFGGILATMSASFFLTAHQEIAAGTNFTDGPLVPLFLFCTLIIALFTLLFASLQTHAYWVRKREQTAVEKSSFLRMASDTLRTPLTGLRWTNELMLSGEFGNITEEQKDSITSMDSAILRVIDLVNELLEVMRLSGGDLIDYNPEPTDIALLIKDAVRDMTSLAGSKHVNIGFGQISHDVLIMTDSPLIRHVLSTLIAGAIHLAKKDTVIVAHAEPTEKTIAIGITYKGEKITFKNFNSTEKSIQKAALPTNLGNLDLTISWEILNTAKAEFWTVDGIEEHTLFIGLPLIAAPKNVEATNISELENLHQQVKKFLIDNTEDIEMPTETAQ